MSIEINIEKLTSKKIPFQYNTNPFQVNTKSFKIMPLHDNIELYKQAIINSNNEDYLEIEYTDNHYILKKKKPVNDLSTFWAEFAKLKDNL